MEKKEGKYKEPDYVFEVSWEVCNKVGGIYTVISTKAVLMQEKYGDHFMMVGPDLYKGLEGNTAFMEDSEMFKTWKEGLDINGIKFRVGRWDIPSKPITILIDFSPLFSNKDQIFGELWSRNQLDSLKGGWDYIEPALFGYACGKIIESFKTFYLDQDTIVLAQFHEWMTGAGVLYLENTVPDVATVFTTHATVTGRALCGRGLPFYSKFNTYNGDQVAKDFNILSKHSLEKAAAIIADTFTTVSDNTAKECEQLLGKAVDKVTINGFDDSFVPNQEVFDKKRVEARENLLNVASAVFGYRAKEDSLIVATSGRYEYKNKGIDLFIDALANLNHKKDSSRDVIAFVTVPAAHTCAKPEVLEGLTSGVLKKGGEPSVATHFLQDPDHDAIWQQIKNCGLLNNEENKVKIVFAPIYLDGRDGVFNMTYYDILIGFDLSVFPSYYEPFGYTPLESLAFHVPTVTTTLTGFGQQVKSTFSDFKEGMLVIERSDFNDETVTEQLSNYIYDFSNKNEKEVLDARAKAYEISRSFLWKNLILNYIKVYDIALKRYLLRTRHLERTLKVDATSYTQLPESNEPIWKSAMVQFKVPTALKDLEILSKNLWWSWNPEAKELYSSIDRNLWEQVHHNPIALLGSITYSHFLKLAKDPVFLENLKNITKKLHDYKAVSSKRAAPKIAYLCMEYGVHESLPIYSGGLGVLAGDYLKEASDQNLDIAAFGLLYRYGYFSQGLTFQGEQIVTYEKQHFTQLPIEPVRDKEGKHLILQIPFRGPIVMVQVWKVEVGRVCLYLFDTDIAENGDQNKSITHHLYGGDKEYRLRQELVLALSALQFMETQNMTPDLVHYNEGHTAFTGLFRLLRAVTHKNLNFEEARQVVTASTLFTTHTAVPAGLDTFDENLLRSYLSHFSEILNVPWNRVLAFGKINASDVNEKFSMSCLAARLSGDINAVSKIHAGVTQKMFQPLWKGFLEEELRINYVTNGVHLATWMAPLWQQLFTETFGGDFLQQTSNPNYWSKITSISSNKIVEIKKELKKELINGIRNILRSGLKDLHVPPAAVYEVLHSLKEDDFIIVFARRFATYKRPDLLFRDLKRLEKLVNHTLKPVKIIVAGKAHPADTTAQKLIKRIVEISEKPQFVGRILFIQNYDMALAQLLVKGADLWLNTPQREKEASGTSGMKAVLNGTLHLSVMDGWWAEAYREDAGWALPQESIYEHQADQDDIDAEMIYNILEYEIIPEYFDKNQSGVSEKWVQRIKNSFEHIAPQVTTTRMLNEYIEKFYSKMYKRVQSLRENNYETTKSIVNWSKNISDRWSKISVVEVQFSNSIEPLQLGDEFNAEVILNLNGLPAKEIGVELVFAKRLKDGRYQINSIEELPMVASKNKQAIYRGRITANTTGAFQYDLRFFPKNSLMQFPRDLPLVKWI